MAKEYATTHAAFNTEYDEVDDWDGEVFVQPEEMPAPIPPAGDGWRMVGVTSRHHKSVGRFFWFWERDVPVTRKGVGERVSKEAKGT